MAFERRDLGEGAFAIVSMELRELGVLAAFTERAGGVSAAPFDSLNVSFTTGDQPDAIRANRKRVIEGLGTPPFAVAGLVHGAKLVRVGPQRAGVGFEAAGEAIAGTDGLLTATPGVAMVVTSADCAPIVLASEKEPTVVVVHAGWRGLAAGIVTRAAAVFERPGAARAAIGPAIGACHYEVGGDVALAVAAGSAVGAETERRDGRLFLDLVGTARRILSEAGVGAVEDTGLCTQCHTDRFFSHRGEGRTGRQAALAMRLQGGP